MLDTITKAISHRPLAAASLAAIGGMWISLGVYNLAAFIHLHFLRTSSLERYKKRPDGGYLEPWALVTGGSDGIGRGFAEELCHRGFNVVLHGRNEKKLDGVRSDLMKQWPSRQIRVLVFDARGDITALEQAIEQLRDLNLKILINNVGDRPSWVSLTQNSPEKIRASIDVDAVFTTQITRLLLPQLVKQSPALVINIGSLSSEAACPYVSILSGTKAYMKAWSRSLNLETRAEGHDVEIIHLLVGMVATANEARTVDLMTPSSRQMASSALDKAGCGHAVVVGYWPHALQHFALTHLPTWVGEQMTLDIAKEGKEREEKLSKSR